MTYDETLNKIHSFLRFGSRLGLERMHSLLRRLGNPQDTLQVIHVAGTNGKGSVCRYLYCVLQDCGYRVGLYTSPYLECFTERMEFDGQEISPELLTECAAPVFEAVDAMLRDGEESPTEFEIVTAIAFLYYQRCAADYVILEVGLGGRGDSTNVIEEPLVSVITTIALDHTAQLGSTVEAIAGEKAGIIKKGCPVVSGAEGGAAAVLQARAAELGCDFFETAELRAESVQVSTEENRFDLIWKNGTDSEKAGLRDLHTGMVGLYQIENACCAYRVLCLLQERGILQIPEQAVRSGFLRARQPGRMEVLSKQPFVLIDGAHNEAGAKALVQTIRRWLPEASAAKPERKLLVLGMLADKDTDAMLQAFLQLPFTFAATEPDNPRKLSSAELAEKIRNSGKAISCMDLGNSRQAAEYLWNCREDYDWIIEAGSLYLIGELRGKWNNENSRKSIVDL